MSFWDSIYSSDNSYFGSKPSILARLSLGYFNDGQCKNILELGCGQGRDTVFFARAGLRVHAIDFSRVSVAQLSANLATLGLEGKVKLSQMDLTKNLPRLTASDAINGVYSHLFYCMPFEDEELQRLFDFVHGTLVKGGLHVFSFRNKKDKSFGKGRKIAKDTFEINGFKVRFFSDKEILAFNLGFKTLRVMKAYEEPCSLSLVFTTRL